MLPGVVVHLKFTLTQGVSFIVTQYFIAGTVHHTQSGKGNSLNIVVNYP